MEHHVDIIKSKPNANKLTDISVCNAIDLSRFKENNFDVVLCMGALYHLNSNNQERAVSESIRVCKSDGMVVFTYLNGEITLDRLENIFFDISHYEMEALAAKYGLEQMHNIYPGGSSFNEAISEASDEGFKKIMERHLLTCEDEDVIEAGGLCLWIGIKPS